MLPQDTELYINQKEGLERLQGNTKIYYKLLNSFVGKSMLASVEEALTAGDIETAATAAHALKGTAGNLSLTALYEAAFALEAKLKAGENSPAEMERLRLVYGKTVEAVRELVGG